MARRRVPILSERHSAARSLLGWCGLEPIADRFLRLFVGAGRAGVRVPGQCGVRHWAILAAVQAAVVLTYVEKQPLQALVHHWGGGTAGGLETLASLVSLCGSGFATMTLGLAGLALGQRARKPALVEAAVVLGAAGIWCWLFTIAGQFVFAERRPNDGGGMRFLTFGGHGVSGHAAAAALLYWPVRDVLARRATPGVRRAASAGLLAWAAIVSWSRVWLGMHFVWNVLLGLAVGAFTGSVTTRAWRELNATSRPNGCPGAPLS